jgi:MFS transporter, Spinster family, sphingosine-1-phosphate transporter
VIISLGPFIQDELDLSNFQFGLVGTAFMLIHSLATVPFGILSDRWSRRKIIALGVFFWSAATLASGFVSSFLALLAARAAVGIGEAAYAPPANSLLSDAFPARERARVLGLFNLGMFVGGAIGLILGGILGGGLLPLRLYLLEKGIINLWLNEALGLIFSWRGCLVLVGLPGFILAIIAWGLREPPKETMREQTSVRVLLSNPLLMYVFAGGIITAFSAGALIWWMPQFVVRIRHLSPEYAGLYIGAVGVSGGLLGVVTGSYLADWLYARWPWGRMATIGTGLILSSPFVTLSLYTTNHVAMMVYFFLGIFLMVWYTAPIIAVIHDVVPADVKATAQALYILLIHLLGDTFSPAIVGKLADLHNLQTALLLPAIINVVGGAIFLAGCRRVGREIQRAQEANAEIVRDLPRTGTLAR